MSKTTIIFVLSAAVLISFDSISSAGVVSSGVRTVKVEGSAAVTPHRSTDALKRAAIDDALATAVRREVGVAVDSRSRTMNFELVESTITTRSSGYARIGRILYEKRMGDRYIVGIEAIVDSRKVLDDVDELLNNIHRAGDPRIVVVVPEELLFRQRVPDPAGETEIISQLIDAGFNVVDQTEIGETRYGAHVERILAGDVLEARRTFGNKADILVVGEAMAERIGDVGGGLISCRARIEVKAIEIGTGRIIGAFAAQEAGIDVTDTLSGKKAIANAASQISTQLKTKLAGYVGGSQGGRNIRLTVSGVNSQRAVSSLTQAISDDAAPGGVQLRSYSGGVAVFDISCDCGSDLMASRIQDVSLDNMSLTVMETSPGKIRANLHVFENSARRW